MRPQAFFELWTLSDELATFDCGAVGLILKRDEGRLEYRATPLNVDTFARTGGNGVHFSLLFLDGVSPEVCPVVMTVPSAMEENRNIIVGSHLKDFLSLGCRFGYFALEQLAYNRERTIAHIESGNHAFSLTPPDDHLLSTIRERLKLRPWTDVAPRLATLHDQYHRLLQMDDELNDL